MKIEEAKRLQEQAGRDANLARQIDPNCKLENLASCYTVDRPTKDSDVCIASGVVWFSLGVIFGGLF